MEVPAYTATGEERAAKVELPSDIFDGTVHEVALHQVATAIQAHQRQGTAATKTREAVRGGGRKPWRQKGTGRARAGTIRSPLWRGGAVVFGPQPRSYDVKVSRKLKQLAIRSALNARALDGDLVVVDALKLDEPRTKAVAALLEGVGATGRKTLLLTDGLDRTVYLSARNIPRVTVKPWGEASAYDLLWAEMVIVEASALGGRPESEAAEDVGGGDQ